ncbi:nucleotide-diphospho-sugar transferase [Ochromonadaceae sp. CCMP2298]|nr:nucleotide-diphospho-sugar transferase [Ochromonadaceae sp. CCMP2298]
MSEHWTTLITTADYAEGVLCLATSLQIVASRAPLLCYVPSPTIEAAILAGAGADHPSNLIVRLIPESCYDEMFQQDITRDGGDFIDAARRFLFLLGEPFVFLDADMIVTRNIDELLDHLRGEGVGAAGAAGAAGAVGEGHGGDVGGVGGVSGTPVGADGGRILAVPNFRNKKRGYGGEEGNFNAGLMVVPRPSRGDYEKMMGMLRGGYADTEEKLLNEVFRDRWSLLPVGYNCQKRAFRLAPAVWNQVLASPSGVRVLHFVGGKPWQCREELTRLDWEFRSAPHALDCYAPLFRLWHRVRRREIGAAELSAAVPAAGTVEGEVEGGVARQAQTAQEPQHTLVP